ncbi:hypothetical protein [Pseudonocardia sp. McavD-2-B]|uniref:hypothetical protein n=1 Tax=Pseudonocardia sp. McavD-2-B TaxID=2954499 RepID=UPI002096FDCB|nr:hypothetical protein [Pseudonocardia sp. McavD-2-B]MCO7195393.1 hypothetical protein [Pseudonocardia sp. McavD-2-B]
MSTQHTDRLRAGALLEARMSAAYRDGRATALAREPRVNPWHGRSDSSVERVLSKMWARGYSAGNPMPLWGDQ